MLRDENGKLFKTNKDNYYIMSGYMQNIKNNTNIAEVIKQITDSLSAGLKGLETGDSTDLGSGNYEDFGYTDYIKKLTIIKEELEEHEKTVSDLSDDWKEAVYNLEAYNKAAASQNPLDYLVSEGNGIQDITYDNLKISSGFNKYLEEQEAGKKLNQKIIDQIEGGAGRNSLSSEGEEAYREWIKTNLNP
jgi:hypothetical protein